MKTKKKLNLDELSVKSFVTNLNDIKGGALAPPATIPGCISDVVRSLCQTCGIICE